MKAIIIRSIRTLLALFFDKSQFPPLNTDFRALTPWLKALWFQKALRFNGRARWPMHPTCRISDKSRIHFPKGEVHNFQSPGVYFQNFNADIYLGASVYIGPNVGLITANHDFGNLAAHLPGQDIHIGDECWIGMNSVILPGVVLGPKTIVGAGSVVSRSFADGNCIIAGSPARVLRDLSVARAGDDSP